MDEEMICTSNTIRSITIAIVSLLGSVVFAAIDGGVAGGLVAGNGASVP